jgi:hypothetical protein
MLDFKYKFIFYIIFILFLFNINYIVASEFNEELNFSATKSKFLYLDINVDMPVYISNYTENSSFTFKTHTFYNSRTQTANFQTFYLNSNNEKILGNIKKDKYGNDIVEFDVNTINQSEFIFRLQGKIASENKIVLNTEKYDLNIPITNENSRISEDIEQYKLATKYIKSNESEIISLAENLKKSNDAVEELVNITNWVHENIEYDLSYADVVNNSLEVLENRKGVCDELSILQAAILRARGYPVKYVVGIANTTLNWGPHAWLEVFIPTQGWIPVDPTYNEVGLVDSSHIILAKVTDPSECEDKVTSTSNINISFGNKNTYTNILEQKSYEDLGYDSYINLELEFPERLRSNSLFEIKFKIKNTTANPVSILSELLIHDEFILLKPKSSKKIIYLDSFEEKTENYYTILPNVEQPMYYNFKIVTQFKDIEDNVIIDPYEDLFYDAFFVLDPVIYFFNSQLAIDTEVINYTLENKIINLMYDNNISKEEDIKEIEANKRVIFTKYIDINDTNKVDYEISGDYNFSKVIYILSNMEVDVIDNNISTQNILEDNIIIDNDYNNDKNTNIWNELENKKIKEKEDSNIMLLVVFAILFIVFLVLLIISKNKN